MKKIIPLILLLSLSLTACSLPSTPLPTAFPSEVSALPTTAPPPASPSPVPIEPSASDALFMSFLNGTTEAIVSEKFSDSSLYFCDGTFEEITRFDFPALAQTISNSFDYLEPDTLKMEVSYALSKTLGGREMLLLRYYCPIGMDEFWFYFIFGVYGQEVQLTYAIDAWSRSRVDLYQDLVFYGSGSSGAGAHDFWCGYIDETGYYCPVYEMEILDGPWIAMTCYDILNGNDLAPDSQCSFLTTGAGQFYEFHAGGSVDQEKVEVLRRHLQEQGMTEVSDIDVLTAAAEEAHGLQDTGPFEAWVPLTNTK